jgi:hypothetical protein
MARQRRIFLQFDSIGDKMFRASKKGRRAVLLEFIPATPLNRPCRAAGAAPFEGKRLHKASRFGWANYNE